MSVSKNSPTKKDMALIRELLPDYDSYTGIPISFTYGDRDYKGLPANWKLSRTWKLLDANISETIVKARDPQTGLVIKAHCYSYRDFPVYEWVVYFKNRSDNPTMQIKNIRSLDASLNIPSPVLYWGRGDMDEQHGYETFEEKLSDEPFRQCPLDGKPTARAYPYMRVLNENKDFGINLSIGWPGGWDCTMTGNENVVNISAGQERTDFYLKKGEVARTPRMTVMAFEGGYDRGMNMWRRWYFAHVLPRENGEPLPPKCMAHVYKPTPELPEFTSATEENQLLGLNEYIRRGVHPDLWWFDAGWHPCNNDWAHVGTWEVNKEHFPNGLGVVGQACHDNDVQFLLWFEPERVTDNTWIFNNHPEWLLHVHDENGNPCAGNHLLNLADPAIVDDITDYIDSLIKEFKVDVYRQDFNMFPGQFWLQNEEENRAGLLENQYVQGYLRYWDGLVERNPNLWIDSCASGGARNDLETMRRAVPLQPTDAYLGHVPQRQGYQHTLLEWTPYFRTHTWDWHDEFGTYTHWEPNNKFDRYCYYTSMVPAITAYLAYDATDEEFEIARLMIPIWRKFAECEMHGDFYPLTPYHKHCHLYTSRQFDCPETESGAILVYAPSAQSTEEKGVTIYPVLDENKTYIFTEGETGESFEVSGKISKDGYKVSLPISTGVVYFYEVKQ